MDTFKHANSDSTFMKHIITGDEARMYKIQM